MRDRKQTPWYGKLGLIVGGVAFALLLCEVGLRVAGFDARKPDQKRFFWVELGYPVKKDGSRGENFPLHPYLLGRLGKDEGRFYYAYDPEAGIYKIGADDFPINIGPTYCGDWDPYPELRVTLPKGARKLVVYGGSTAFGWLLKSNQSVPARLQDILRLRPGMGDVFVVNAGRLADDSLKTLRLLEKVSTEERPALNIHLGGDNEFNEFTRPLLTQRVDMELLRYLDFATRASEGSLHLRFPKFLRGLFIRDFGEPKTNAALKQALFKSFIDLSSLPEPLARGDEDFIRKRMDRYRDNLTRMVEVSRSRNIPILLCTMPINIRRIPAGEKSSINREALERFEKARQCEAAGNSREALKLYLEAVSLDKGWMGAKPIHNDVVVKVGETTGAPVARLDRIAEFYDLSRQDNGFIDLCHFSAFGADLCARVIAEKIVEEGLLER